MRRTLISAAFAIVAMVPPPANAALIATCGATTPTIQVNPQGGVEPVRPIEGCVVTFTIEGNLAKAVTTLLDPADNFFGDLGLRVRGTNALWTDHFGRFVRGELVDGVDTKTFNISPGSWVFELYLTGPVGAVRPGYQAVGSFSGSLTG